jgi:hypothetical protein
MDRPLPSVTCRQRHRAGDGLDQRGLALAVGAEDADALAGQHRAVDAAQMVVSPPSSGSRSGVHRQHGVGQVGGFLELEGELGIGQHRRDLLHALQRLDPALRLLGLAGLGLEAVDELLQVGDLVLLLGEAACCSSICSARMSSNLL